MKNHARNTNFIRKAMQLLLSSVYADVNTLSSNSMINWSSSITTRQRVLQFAMMERIGIVGRTSENRSPSCPVQCSYQSLFLLMLHLILYKNAQYCY